MLLLQGIILLAAARFTFYVLAQDQIPLCYTSKHNGDHHYYGIPSVEEWEVAAAKASKFVASLNSDEKVHMVTGDSYRGMCVGNLAPIMSSNFSGLCMSDGPQAVNRADLISVFPSGVTAAATWDKNLIHQRAHLMGKEFRDKGIHVHLGPVSGPLGRHAMGGRNWEGYSPDPYLAGIATALTVSGIQAEGVQTSSKHFIGNEQETRRSKDDGPHGVDAITSNIDDKTLHELYLWPFADAVRAGTTSIMCSYNRVNSTYACHNEKLLTEILRDELGFRGYVVSDWWATHATVEAANSGLDLEMPGWEDRQWKGDPWFGDNLRHAIERGYVKQERLDEMITRVMTPYFLLGQDDGYPSVDQSIAWVAEVTKHGWRLEADAKTRLPPIVDARDVRSDHAEFIREMGAAATVLLKNEGVLPLKNPKTIAVFGQDAGDPADGMYRDGKTEMGTLDIGGGSGTARHANLVTPLAAIRSKAEEIGARVPYVLNHELILSGDTRMIYPKPDVCIVFTKSWAGEGSDRESLSLDWDGNRVIASVASWCSSTIVVVHAGGVVAMPWAYNPNVTAIVAAHYPGEESGHSIVDIMWGAVNPSGKLPYTIPINSDDYQPPVVREPDKHGNWVSNFEEGPMVDYRYFDKYGIETLFPFGFGMSYTDFEVGHDGVSFDLGAEAEASLLRELPDRGKGKAPGGWVDLWSVVVTASVPITNIGNVTGHVVVQLYMGYPRSEVDQPLQSLRGFERVFLHPGETAEVRFPLRRKDLSVWDVGLQEWRIPRGRFVFWAGLSSRDKVDGRCLTLLAE